MEPLDLAHYIASLNSPHDPIGTVQQQHAVADPITASYAKQADSSDRSKGPVNLIVENQDA